MSNLPPGTVTRLLHAWKDEHDETAAGELFRLLEDDLNAAARHALRRMGGMDHKIQPTELVNELFIKLADYDVSFANRRYFFGMICKIVRNILRDIAKHDAAEKRPPSVMRVVPAAGEELGRQESEVEVTDFYRALDRLRQLNEQHADIFEMRAVLGLTLEETAETMQVSTGTVKRAVRAAKAWLVNELGLRPE